MAGVKGRSGRKPKADATPRTRGRQWMATRERILARDGRLCRCEQCLESGAPLAATEVDHKIPLWEGGLDEDANLQALHNACHKRKSAEEAARRSAAGYAVPAPSDDPLDFLIGVMNDVGQDARLRVRAAVAACQYVHTKTHDGGKKDEKDRAADEASSGRFAPQVGPRLVSNR